MSLSDSMLSAGAMPHLEVAHGERVKVLDGVDAGKWFVGIIEIESDQVLESEVLNDPRAKRMLRFKEGAGNVPSAGTKKLVKLQTEDGRKWAATRQDLSAYLSVDFELVQITN